MKKLCSNCSKELKSTIDIEKISNSLEIGEVHFCFCYNCTLSGITKDNKNNIWLISGRDGTWLERDIFFEKHKLGNFK